MYFTKSLLVIFNTCRWLVKILPAVFWILVIFGFDSPPVALSTLFCAAVHELGHISAYKILGGGATIRSSHDGLRLHSKRIYSYPELTFIAAMGPLFNFAAAIICLPFLGLFGGFFKLLSILNLLTGISNLFPVKGYDGYNIAKVVLANFTEGESAQDILEKISSVIIVFMCFLSLYFILIANTGYWIYFIFLISLIRRLSK